MNPRLASVSLLAIFLLAASPAQHLYDAALDEIGARSPVPIYVPSSIPDVVRVSEIGHSEGSATETGYQIGLYYQLDIGDAGFAGMIAGSTSKAGDDLLELPGTQRTSLPGGSPAWFRAVSCGGSCAPANLWWNIGEAGYQIQLKISPAIEEHDQLQAMIQMADSVRAARHAV